jgi:opacity protein-like surface antigen
MLLHSNIHSEEYLLVFASESGENGLALQGAAVMGIQDFAKRAAGPAALAIVAALGAVTPASAQFLDGFMENIQPGGFYVGGQVGGVNGQGTIDYTVGSTTTDGSWPISGFSAGIFAGYDWYYGDILFGIEGDLNLAAAGGAGTGTTSGSYTYEYGTDLHSFGSLRKRLGMVFGPWTFFATGGFAFASSTFWSEDCPTGPGSCTPNDDQSLSQFGFTGGGGVQYAINDMMAIRGAVNFFSFRPVDVELGSPSSPPAPVNQSFVVASIGVLVHFQ